MKNRSGAELSPVDETSRTGPLPVSAPLPANDSRTTAAHARWTAAAALLIALMAVVRFVLLNKVPPGFFRDEAGGALNALCVAQTGADATGTPWRVFFPQFGYWAPPTYIYFNAVWSLVFGPSIAAFRASSAFFGTLTVFAVYALTRLYSSRNAALLALLSASISPSLFHFSRMAWETSMMPAYHLWGLYFFLRSDRKRDLCISAVLLGLCCYTYSAGRVVVPLSLPLAAWVRQVRQPARGSSVLLFSAVFAATCAPLAYGSLWGTLMARANDVALFSKDFLKPYAGPRPLLVFTFYIENLFEHFSLDFLFFHGDANPRHGLRSVGHLSWLDAFALGLGLALLARHFLRAAPDRFSPQLAPDSEAQRRWLVFVLVAIVIGVTPAAITHEGLPHAIRSCGAWPVYSLWVGVIFNRLELSGRAVLKPAVITALAFVAYFLPCYFYRYPTRAASWFDEGQIALFNHAFTHRDAQAIRRMLLTYDALPLRYQLMAEHGVSCQGSRVFFDRLQQR